MIKPSSLICCILISFCPDMILAGTGKLQEHAGITQLEGSGGGGLTPWATLSGFDSDEEYSAGVFTTHVSTQDFGLQVFGATLSVYDRVELGIARQAFELNDQPAGIAEINQSILSIKTRIVGDAIYSRYPQISAGLQYKSLKNDTIASALGAKDLDHGYDAYLTATQAHLGLFFGYNLAWNLTLRLTKANQFGLLGYGGDKNDQYRIQPEGSLALFLNRSVAIGMEYRAKPDNLNLVKEEAAYDAFIAIVPNKQVNLTLAWVDLGSIAGSEPQTGPYVSFTGYLW